jgi:hypothetical protein
MPTWLVRAVGLLVATLLIEIPVNSPARMALWACLAIWLATGRVRAPSRLTLRMTVATATLFGLTVWFPRPVIQEGHQVYLGDGRSEALERVLPPVARTALLKEFMETYPPERWCSPAVWGCWRYYGPVLEPFAFSADGVFQRGVRFSRIVEEIDVDSIASLRGGFANIVTADARPTTLNWWDPATDVHRDRMQFDAQSVG